MSVGTWFCHTPTTLPSAAPVSSVTLVTAAYLKSTLNFDEVVSWTKPQCGSTPLVPTMKFLADSPPESSIWMEVAADVLSIATGPPMPLKAPWMVSEPM